MIRLLQVASLVLKGMNVYCILCILQHKWLSIVWMDVVNALLGTSAGGRPEDRLGQELRFQVVKQYFWRKLSLSNLTSGHKPVWGWPFQTWPSPHQLQVGSMKIEYLEWVVCCRYANLRGAKLSGANLSWSLLERADLSHCQVGVQNQP